MGTGKAVRIIQIAHDPEDQLLTAWLDQTEGSAGNSLKELVIPLQLTRKNRTVALMLLEKWVVTEDQAAMQACIDATVEQV